MIVFPTKNHEVYNYIIHHFLKVEVYDGCSEIGDIIEMILPKYLYREQYKKCVKVLEELYVWTEDKFYHQMDAFHEIMLNGFLGYLSDIQSDDDEFFYEIYFDDNCHKLIDEVSKKYFEESDDEFDCDFTIDEYKLEFYDISCWFDILFVDEDFLLISEMYNSKEYGNGDIVKKLGINLDYYYELLPLDIQKKYKTKHITLTGEIHDLLKYLNKKIKYGNLFKLFWENDLPVKEDRIQLVLENIMDAYFYNQEIDITREALLGNGKVDFKLYKSSCPEDKVLVEIKRANSSYLRKGYEKQLTDYMLSSSYNNAFYLIACYTDEEINKSLRFIKEHIYTDEIQLYINISILDLRKRRTASKF